MKIAIVGCGWVGVRLSAYLKQKGHHLIATTTSPEKVQQLKTVASQVYLFDFTNTEEIPACETLDAVIFSMPAANPNWHAGFKKLELETNHSVFFSSTGIYPQQNGVFTEENKEGLRADLVSAERTVSAKYPQTIVLRLGGIMGDGRSLQNFYRSKSPPDPEKLANHIHFTDIILAVEAVLNSPPAGETYNLVAPVHPTVGEILDLEVHRSDDSADGVNGRIISSQKFIDDFNYTFKHPNPKYF